MRLMFAGLLPCSRLSLGAEQQERKIAVEVRGLVSNAVPSVSFCVSSPCQGSQEMCTESSWIFK